MDKPYLRSLHLRMNHSNPISVIESYLRCCLCNVFNLTPENIEDHINLLYKNYKSNLLNTDFFMGYFTAEISETYSSRFLSREYSHVLHLSCSVNKSRTLVTTPRRSS